MEYPKDLGTLALFGLGHAKCLRCGRECLFFVEGDYLERLPRHIGADGMVHRGCRAASFEPGKGWDESLDRRWTAKLPKKAVQAGG